MLVNIVISNMKTMTIKQHSSIMLWIIKIMMLVPRFNSMVYPSPKWAESSMDVLTSVIQHQNWQSFVIVCEDRFCSKYMNIFIYSTMKLESVQLNSMLKGKFNK